MKKSFDSSNFNDLALAKALQKLKDNEELSDDEINVIEKEVKLNEFE